MDTSQYSIGIVTYHARFETYFKPLIKRLVHIFPDKEIICVLNGHPDRTLQMQYLDKATRFLALYPTVRYLTYDTHQSLAKCWNQVMILSSSPKTLLLNDDTQVSELFRTELENTISTKEIFTINNSWSHFVISKNTVKTVGWFDERLLGLGYEDGDYSYRMAMQNVEMQNVDCTGIRNYVAEQSNPSWTAVSTTDNTGRYSTVNREFFYQKWQTPENSPTTTHFAHKCIFNYVQSEFTPVTGMETPTFYDFSLLENTPEQHSSVIKYTSSPAKLLVQKIYYRGGRLVKKILRQLHSK